MAVDKLELWREVMNGEQYPYATYSSLYDKRRVPREEIKSAIKEMSLG
ncbi:hypothetical protein [Paenibacillus monticola]|uniref:Uncharacterized protein n=1 Tax=Paenibacillus monticola TaxID=2666075 RepID=A0A7X2H587_9BACL|nr:hypothetical protein [Paenibacillus monticola]MRN53771.1 hypothetical protein [Paenibacillus monticola]